VKQPSATGREVEYSRGSKAVTPALVRVDDLDEELPENVFVLVLPGDVARGGGVELWRTHRRDRTLVGYSSISGLVSACGGGQPWALLARDQLIQVCDEHEITIVALDLPLPEGHRYPEPDAGEQPDLDDAVPLHDGGLLFVASRPLRSWTELVELELQPDARGRLMLLAYTSQEELDAGCGPHQAWVSIPAELLGEAAWRAGADGVLFNPILAEESRHTGPVHDWTRAR
jgi:hypothetical protein